MIAVESIEFGKQGPRILIKILKFKKKKKLKINNKIVNITFISAYNQKPVTTNNKILENSCAISNNFLQKNSNFLYHVFSYLQRTVKIEIDVKYTGTSIIH